MKRSLLPFALLLALSACSTSPQPATAATFRPDVLYYDNTKEGKAAAEELRMLFGDRQEVVMTDAMPPEISGFPQIISSVRPKFPPEVGDLTLKVKVTVEFIVGESGKVLEAAVVETSDARFNGAAVASIRQWTFKPAMRAGVPVRTILRVPIMFERGS